MILPEYDSMIEIAMSENVESNTPLLLYDGGAGRFEFHNGFLAAFTEMHEVWVSPGFLCD
jgi:hypothetical protein